MQNLPDAGDAADAALGDRAFDPCVGKWATARPSAPLDGGAVTADVPGDLLAAAVHDHRFLNPPRQFILGEGGKRTQV